MDNMHGKRRDKNVRYKKYIIKNEEFLDGLINDLNIVGEIISELEGRSIEMI